MISRILGWFGLSGLQAGIMLALVGGLGLATWQWIDARGDVREARRDVREAAIANDSLLARLRLEQANAALSAQLAAEYQRSRDERIVSAEKIRDEIGEVSDATRASTAIALGACAPDPAVDAGLRRALSGGRDESRNPPAAGPGRLPAR